MCLRTEQNKPQVATKDIICYKVISKDMTSLYHYDFKWTFGKMYYSLIEAINDTKDCDSKEIYQAFHSYETLEDLKKAYFTVTSPCLAVKCTIPKGSTVYKGSHDDLNGYASNQLIINEVISTKELYPDFDWDNYPYKEGQVIQVKIPHYKYWHDIMYSSEQKLHDDIWNDYQITNLQLREGQKGSRVDLILENCETLGTNFVITKFDGRTWQTDKEVKLKENKEE